MFEFYLADRLGMSVGQLRTEMTSAEFLEWSMYHQLRAQQEELAMKKGR